MNFKRKPIAIAALSLGVAASAFAISQGEQDRQAQHAWQESARDHEEAGRGYTAFKDVAEAIEKTAEVTLEVLSK